MTGAPNLNTFRRMGSGLNTGVELVFVTLTGGAVGFALDRWLGSVPLFLLLGLLLGMAGALWLVARTHRDPPES